MCLKLFNTVSLNYNIVIIHGIIFAALDFRYKNINLIFKLQLLSILDKPTIRNLLQVAEPKFQLLHHTFITSKVLLEAYSEVQTVVERVSYSRKVCHYNRSVDITIPATVVHVPYCTFH